MPQAGAIRAGRAYVELFADDSKLVHGLRAAARKLKAFGAGVRDIGLRMVALGAAVAVPMFAAARSFADMGSKLWDMSKRTGVSVEALSVLGYAAEQSGADLSSLETGLRKMQKTIGDAASGSASAQEALALLGLTVKDLAGLAPEQQFKLLADRLSKIADPTLKAAAAMEVFGKSGTGLLPMLKGGAEALDAYTAKARKLGLVMSTADAKAADEFGDALTDLWRVLKRTTFTIGSALAPLLQRLSEWITSVAAKMNAWIQRNKELIVTVFKVAIGVIAAGASLVILGTAIIGVAKGLAILAAVLSVVGGLLKIVGASLVFLLSPIGLVSAGLVALGSYFLYASGIAGDALDWLGGRFGILRDDAAASLEGIGNALAAEDIPLAAKILWASLKLAWLEGTSALREAWTVFSFAFKLGWGQLSDDVTAMWLDMIYGIRSAWEDFQHWHAQAVNTAAKGLFAAWMWARKKIGTISEEQYQLEMRIGLGAAKGRDGAFACSLHSGCCFGRFRSNPANPCPTGRW